MSGSSVSCIGSNSIKCHILHVVLNQHIDIATVQLMQDYKICKQTTVCNELFSSGGQTDRRTQSDAYEPNVHKHRCTVNVQYHTEMV